MTLVGSGTITHFNKNGTIRSQTTSPPVGVANTTKTNEPGKYSGPEVDYTNIRFDGNDADSDGSYSSDKTGVPFWGALPSAWDFVYFGQFKLPGICRVSGDIKRRSDPKAISGKKGKTHTFLGDDAAEFEIKIRMWTAEHLQTYVALVKAWKPSLEKIKGTTGNKIADYPVFDIFHPALNVYEIHQCHLLAFGILEPEGDDGFYSSKIKCVQYTPNEIRDKSGTGTPGQSGTILSRGAGAIAEKVDEQSKKSSTPKPSEVNFSANVNYSQAPTP